VLDLTSGRPSDGLAHTEQALESVEARSAELRDALSGQVIVRIEDVGCYLGARSNVSSPHLNFAVTHCMLDSSMGQSHLSIQSRSSRGPELTEKDDGTPELPVTISSGRDAIPGENSGLSLQHIHASWQRRHSGESITIS